MRCTHLLQSFVRSSAAISLGIVLSIGMFTPVSHAQPSFGSGMVSSPPNSQQPPVVVTIESSVTQVAPGSDLVLAVILDHAEHYHSNLNDPIVPKEMGDFYPVPTTLSLPDIQGLSFGGVHWPTPVAVDVDFFFTGTPISYQVYTGKAIVYVPVSIDSDAELGDREIELNLSYQACDETTCLPPTNVKLITTISIVESVASVDSAAE
ncbi:MAG: hypothetical protein JKX70_05695 [Phycisphaerales bacterium]|nr:hypothetical protein [Phycisphaerales bacterium]